LGGAAEQPSPSYLLAPITWMGGTLGVSGSLERTAADAGLVDTRAACRADGGRVEARWFMAALLCGCSEHKMWTAQLPKRRFIGSANIQRARK
jgi:hypothetical protein